MKSISLKLQPGSDLRQSVEKLAQEKQMSGFVLGVVGNLSKATFQCPGRPEPTVLEGNLEIITLNGTFLPSGVHLHLSLSDSECQVWGGHLEPGTIILKSADLLLGLVELQYPDIPSSTVNYPSKAARIEIAIMPGCPWCSRAIRLLKSSGLLYDIIKVDNDSTFESVKKRTSVTTFPQIFIDNKFIGGYESLSELKASGKLYQLE